MTRPKPTSPDTHPIQPYTEALTREHEENLVSGRQARLTGLLESHGPPTKGTVRVTVVRSAGPARPFEGAAQTPQQGGACHED